MSFLLSSIDASLMDSTTARVTIAVAGAGVTLFAAYCAGAKLVMNYFAKDDLDITQQFVGNPKTPLAGPHRVHVGEADAEKMSDLSL